MGTQREGFASAAEQNAARLLDFLKKQSGLSDEAIGRRVGRSRVSIHNQRTGKQRIDVSDLARFGEAFDVPPSLFLLSHAEALTWLIENRHPIIRIERRSGGDVPFGICERRRLTAV